MLCLKITCIHLSVTSKGPVYTARYLLCVVPRVQLKFELDSDNSLQHHLYFCIRISNLLNRGFRDDQKLRHSLIYHNPGIPIYCRQINAPVDFEELLISGESEKESITDAIVTVKRNGVALKGNIHTDRVGELLAGKTHNVRLR